MISNEFNIPTAKVIADSITEDGHRLTTVEARCWRPVLAEQNTHRVYSRNSASMRAIPVYKILDRFVDEFAYPLEWPSEKKGMQGGSELTGKDQQDAQGLWEDIADFIAKNIEHYVNTHPDPATRLHKSLLNRWLEPGLMQTMIISGTTWDGYFWQRCHKDAEVHIRGMAEAIRTAINASKPEEINVGEWHLPYWSENGGHTSDWIDAMRLSDGNWDKQDDIAKRCSVARCARVSYMNHSGVRSLQDDLDLYDHLVVRKGDNANEPYHGSALEHVATPCSDNAHGIDITSETSLPGDRVRFRNLPKLGNFTGWLQYRHQELGF